MICRLRQVESIWHSAGLSAPNIACVLRGAGANRVLAMDLHSGQCVGYFDIPVDHVYGDSVILDYLASKRICTGDLVVVSPDVGGVARARAFAKKLNDAPLVRCRHLAADGVYSACP